MSEQGRDHPVRGTGDALGDFFARLGKRRVLTEGEVLYRSGSPPEAVFLVVQGSVAVHDARPGSAEPVGSKSPGDLVGEVAALLDVPRAVTARATGPATVLEIPADEFRGGARRDPQLAYDVAFRLAETVLASTTGTGR